MPVNYPSIRALTRDDVGAYNNVPDYAGALSKGMDLFQKTYESAYKPRNLENKAISEEQANQINAPYAAGAKDIYNLDVQQKQALLNQLKQTMNQKQQDYNDKMFLQNLINGTTSNSSRNNRSNIPSLSGYNAPSDLNITQAKGIQSPSNYSDNGMSAEGPGISASPSAYDTFPGRRTGKPRIEHQNVPQENMDSSITSVPDLSQNIKNGLENKNNEQILNSGNPKLERLNEVYDNYPQYRKKLEDMGYKKTQTTKYDPKTGIASVMTTYPNGKVTVQATVPESGENNPATMAIRTASQKTINAIHNATPIIDKLIQDTKNGDVPGQWIGHYFHPDLQAAYFSNVIQSSDTLAGGLGFPATNEGLHQAQQTIIRKPRESDAGYIKRLEDLKVDMATRKKNAQVILEKGVSTKNKEKKGTASNVMTFNPKTGRLE